MTFAVGNTVKLNSGGPVMTVRQVSETSVETIWMSDKGEVLSASFRPETVKAADPPPS